MPTTIIRAGLRLRLRPRALVLAVASTFGMAGLAPAHPTGAQAIAGSVSLAAQGPHLVVTTTNAPGTQHSAIDWQSFSVPRGGSTWFAQPHAASTAINRVLGPDPSRIYGSLGSNGRVVLVNPAGIAVGPGAVVDTAGFTASTLAMREADAIAGRLRFASAGGVPGPLDVQGRVLARGGDVVLLAPQVQVGQDALVRAEGGATVVAAGQRVELTGRGLEGIHFALQAPDDRALTLGTLEGDAVGIFAGSLRHSGLVRAQAAAAGDGRVVLRSAGATELAPGAVLQAPGGTVHVLGDTVAVGRGSRIDVSSDAGGGTILVGGDFQGRNAAVPNARTTRIDPGAQLVADARTAGDGGRVIVWSDGTTVHRGHVSARGGPQGGDGGFAEVSGRERLRFEGTADLGAAHGRRGRLLLDPANITVGTVADLDGNNSLGDDIASPADLDTVGDQGAADSRISAAALTGLLNTMDVTLAATNNITIATAIVKTGTTGATTLMLDANTIDINDSIRSTGDPLHLSVNAPGGATLRATYERGTLTSVTGRLETAGTAATLVDATIEGPLLVGGTDLSIKDSLVLGHLAVLDTGALNLAVRGSATISTAGTATLLRSGGTIAIGTDGVATVTIGPNVTLQGSGEITLGGFDARLVNKGTLHSDTPGGMLHVNKVTDFSNEGTLKVTDGTLRVAPINAWTNTGAIVQGGGRLELLTNLTWDQVNGRFTRTGGDVILAPGYTFDLGGNTLDIGAGGPFGTGGLTTAAGTLKNGTLLSGDATPLGGDPTLDAVRIASDLTVNGSLSVRNGLTLDDGVTVTLPTSGAGVYVLGSQAIGSPGTATLHASSAGRLTVHLNPTGPGTDTLTLGPGLTFRGNVGFAEANPNATVVNQGVIEASAAGQLVAAATTTFVNDGTLRLAAGTTFQRTGGLVNGTAGVIEGSGTVDVGGGVLDNRGVLRPGGTGAAGTLAVTGALDTSNGRLEIEMASTASYDAVTASGNVTLGAGTVLARADLPAFSYGPGDVFDVARSAGTVTGPAPVVAGFGAAVQAAPAALRLTAGGTPPPSPPPTNPPPPPTSPPAPPPTNPPAPLPTTAPPPPPVAPTTPPVPVPTASPAPPPLPTAPAPTSAPKAGPHPLDSILLAQALQPLLTQARADTDREVVLNEVRLDKDAAAGQEKKEKDKLATRARGGGDQCRPEDPVP